MAETPTPSPAPTPPPGLTTEPPKTSETPTPAPGQEQPSTPEPAKTEEPPKQEEPAAPPVAFDPKELKLPEGVTLDEKMVGDFAAVINDAELAPAERAQKLIDMQIAREQAAAENAVKAWSDLQEKWQQEVRDDPTIGGANFETSIQRIDAMLDTYKATPEEREAFKITGAGNNPHIVRLLHRIAKDVAEAKPASGQPAASTGLTADKLYPTMTGTNK